MASEHWTVGSYLARRLQDAGMGHYFAVPGDYNLVLLDELLGNQDLKMISCCNELNAGYAADGYARATGGPSAAVVTFSVGGLSLINAVAGAYAEDLPMIAISGGPNTNSEAEWEYLHHTLGKVDYDYQREMFARVTADAVTIHHPSLAPVAIDRAIDTAMLRRKPVYIEIAANIAGAPTSAPIARGFARQVTSDPDSLAAAVEHVAEFLNAADRPVLVAGGKVRAAGAEAALRSLGEACGYAQASMPNAKSFLSEAPENFMGIYWGPRQHARLRRDRRRRRCAALCRPHLHRLHHHRSPAWLRSQEGGDRPHDLGAVGRNQLQQCAHDRFPGSAEGSAHRQ